MRLRRARSWRIVAHSARSNSSPTTSCETRRSRRSSSSSLRPASRSASSVRVRAGRSLSDSFSSASACRRASSSSTSMSSSSPPSGVVASVGLSADSSADSARYSATASGMPRGTLGRMSPPASSLSSFRCCEAASSPSCISVTWAPGRRNSRAAFFSRLRSKRPMSRPAWARYSAVPVAAMRSLRLCSKTSGLNTSRVFLSSCSSRSARPHAPMVRSGFRPDSRSTGSATRENSGTSSTDFFARSCARVTSSLESTRAPNQTVSLTSIVNAPIRDSSSSWVRRSARSCVDSSKTVRSKRTLVEGPGRTAVNAASRSITSYAETPHGSRMRCRDSPCSRSAARCSESRSTSPVSSGCGVRSAELMRRMRLRRRASPSPRPSIAKPSRPAWDIRCEKSPSSSSSCATKRTLRPECVSEVDRATASWVAPVPGGVSTTSEAPSSAASTTACWSPSTSIARNSSCGARSGSGRGPWSAGSDMSMRSVGTPSSVAPEAVDETAVASTSVVAAESESALPSASGSVSSSAQVPGSRKPTRASASPARARSSGCAAGSDSDAYGAVMFANVDTTSRSFTSMPKTGRGSVRSRLKTGAGSKPCASPVAATHSSTSTMTSCSCRR